MTWPPIAVVGRGCVLPGALTPEQLWANVAAARDGLGPVPAGRWRLGRDLVETAPGQARGQAQAQPPIVDRGGYVEGFEEVFDPRGFHLPAEEVAALDPVFRWVAHAGREALRAIGHQRPSARAGLILGNLSFPSSAMARFAEGVWLDAQGDALCGGRGRALAGVERPHARNRFGSGLPALLAARALGLAGGAFALDAACASSLYAIKLACDRLHDRTADVMVAGAVNAADDLFIHAGFVALGAMSPSGRSRPFHRDADGLVPAEGAALVVLKRLDDAVRAGDRILGVIRAVGLSNDGRGKGFLAPAEEGQVRAMRMAYGDAGLSPGDVSLVECHATGTPVGDATEIRSMAALFGEARDLPIGSLKSNFGHLITAAGAAALLKVLGAMEAGVRPASLHADAPIEALGGTPFRLLAAPEPWTAPGARPRLAAVSAFGFGGNDAHLLVEAWDGAGASGRGGARSAATSGQEAATPTATAIAVVGLGMIAGGAAGVHAVADATFSGRGAPARCEAVTLSLAGLRFPPRDLERALPQQLLILAAAREAAEGLSLPRERTSVLVGMGCDPEVARSGAEWRIAAWCDDWNLATGGAAGPAWLAAARAAIGTPIDAAAVVGRMPNIPANRLNSQLDLGGPSFTVSAEELSGTVALELGVRALRAGEADAVLAGAVDLSDEPVHRAALAALGVDAPAGDGAVVLALKRLDDARRDGDRVLAVIDIEPGTPVALPGDSGGEPPAQPWAPIAEPHAAAPLMRVATAVLSVERGARPRPDGTAAPWFGPRALDVVAATALDGGVRAAVRVAAAGPARALLLQDRPRLHVFSGDDRADVRRALRAGHESRGGPARLVIVAASPAELRARGELALRALDEGGPLAEGLAFREKPPGGDVAFVFTGAAASYVGMGCELALALPDLAGAIVAGAPPLARRALDWVHGARDAPPRHPLDQLWAASYVCQLHARLTLDVLRLAPAAAIGYSSGESNALHALGVWRDLGPMLADLAESPLFNVEIAGEMRAVRRAWGLPQPDGDGRDGAAPGCDWAVFGLAADAEIVRAALAGEARAHLAAVNAPGDCTIAGDRAACLRAIDRVRERVAARISARAGAAPQAVPLDYRIAAHCPEIAGLRQQWLDLHRRPTEEVPGVRFYSNAWGAPYRPTPDAAAAAITDQVLGMLDFPRVIERAYADGVRVFVEHGPRALCTRWIDRILGDRDHVAVALDQPGRGAVRQVMGALAWLVAAGVPVDDGALDQRLATARPAPRDDGAAVLTFPAHPPAIRLPPLEMAIARMAPSPRLRPVDADAEADIEDPVGVGVGVGVSVSDIRATATAAVGVTATRIERPPQIARTAPIGLIPRVAEVHRQFIALQAAVHGQYLRSQQALLERLARPRAPAPQPPLTEPQTPPAPAGERPGPRFSRAELERLASGRISDLLGPAFRDQDRFHRQVRMPEPPLLLADRVTGIDAVPGSMATGTIWTETDVRDDSWYLHDGRMPAGLMIEAGQADLLLISWLGIDRHNRGERVYRLLGCEVTYHGEAPAPGDTLAFEIRILGHAAQGAVRLFFFEYDCRVRGQLRLAVRHGQAGFFSDDELARSGGVLWDAAETEPPATGPQCQDPPAVPARRRAFSGAELRAFAAGRPFDAFGAGFERARAHVRSPRIPDGRMLLLDRVTDFDPAGGPWRRGYLRAERDIAPGDWFFAGHFLNDPCMPGTLMFEACLQAMAVYLAAMGFTLDRDGWRFEVVPEQTSVMRCRGQVVPTSRLVACEVFVHDVSAGPLPTIHADLLGTVDGRKAFHARRVGLRLCPDWPLEVWRRGPVACAGDDAGPAPQLARLGGLAGHVEPRPSASAGGVTFDYPAMLACAWGRPSNAFGPMYARFDGPRAVARLPGPPYHFISRVTGIDARMGELQPGGSIEAEYDVPPDAWYFDDSGSATMPLAVIMEVALQPCGWLASFAGSTLRAEHDLLFRNLDGTATLHAEVGRDAGTLRTRVRLTAVSDSAGMILESFDVRCMRGETTIYEMTTSFGFFPREAFDDQPGLPVTAEERRRITEGQRGDRDGGGDGHGAGRAGATGTPRLASGKLLMIDRITARDPGGGARGLGWWRAEKVVDAGEWFFKAHFFQDPVQPGSLGIEALGQLLQLAMIEHRLGDGAGPGARFEPLALGRPLTWKYRGQVTPASRIITTEMEIVEVGEDARGRYAIGNGALWVDGVRIYRVERMAMRIVSPSR